MARHRGCQLLASSSQPAAKTRGRRSRHCATRPQASCTSSLRPRRNTTRASSSGATSRTHADAL
eukprot:771748-Pyramimonas_sp.AAC.1